MTHDGVFGIHGDQPGSNLCGQYWFWHRVYDVSLGRWTTTDPAAAPFWNLRDYVGSNPLTRNDPTGLFPKASTGSAGGVDNKRRSGAFNKHNRIVPFTFYECECCDEVWILNALAAATEIIMDASVLADEMKRRRDEGKTGWMGYKTGSRGAKMLDRLGWWKVDAGENSTEFLDRLQANLDAMYWRLVNTGWNIICDCNDDDCTYWGKVSSYSAPWNSDRVWTAWGPMDISCGCLNNSRKNVSDSHAFKEIVKTIIHEMSHLAAATDDNDNGTVLDQEELADSADNIEKLGDVFDDYVKRWQPK